MIQINRIVLEGRLVRDPEHKQAGESEFAAFTIAHDQGKDQDAAFLDVVAFRATGKAVMDYMHKGDLVTVDGRLRCRKGETKTFWSITADTVVKRSIERQGDSDAPAQRDIPDSELPF